jgi:predicted O-methyltransferase YrrM
LITQRFNKPIEWNKKKANHSFLGLAELIIDLKLFLKHNEFKGSSMIEIGSYMGESTMMFASSQLFNKVYTIDPHQGKEPFNSISGLSWKDIKKEFNINTRYFDNIELIQEYSQYCFNKFEDNSIDFLYIDANHNYLSVKSDLELYIPKLKGNCVIAGHDYCDIKWPGVIQAVNEVLGKPTKVYQDTSWVYLKKELL